MIEKRKLTEKLGKKAEKQLQIDKREQTEKYATKVGTEKLPGAGDKVWLLLLSCSK